MLTGLCSFEHEEFGIGSGSFSRGCIVPSEHLIKIPKAIGLEPAEFFHRLL